MIKLAKYLKPFIFMLLATAVFLYLQAMADLALPDYMSNIVNKGLQQSGIVDAVPEALRKSLMDKLLLLMEEKEREAVIRSYTLIDESSPDYNAFLDQYPGLKNEAIYVLNKVDNEQRDQLNSIMGRAILAVSGIEKMKEMETDTNLPAGNIKIPADMDPFDWIQNLQEEQRALLKKAMDKQFAAMDEKAVTQSAVVLIKEEYIALGMDIDRIQRNYILKTGFVMLLISLAGGACAVLVGFLSARTSAGLGRNLRKSVFAKVESFSNTEFDKFSTASLITRTTNDINQVQMVVIMLMRMAFMAPIMGIGGIIRALEKSLSMSWIIALGVILLLCLIFTIFSIATPKFKIIQKLVDRINLVSRENLSGMMVIRAFGTERFEEERFDRANRDLTNTNLFINRVMTCMFPMMNLIMNGITLLIIWVGAHQIANSSMQVGDMMVFMQYAMQIIFSFLNVSMMFIMIPRASVSAGRVAEVLETEPVIVDPKEPKKFDEALKGVVEFKNVSFRYPGAEEDVLKNISFKALPGKTTAIIGSTGSGKTTLVNLIPRFYDVTEGQVLVSGVDVREVSQKELREKIGYVPQKAVLFSGTIESNLKYANDRASKEDLEEASEIAQAMEFISEKPDGFQSEIAQGGANVSGGQKQRLSIARALVKKPEIYIFDDSFSALDYRTDAALRRQLKEKTATSTVLIVAQRIATILNADQIIVLDEGKIVGIGTHRELMENCRTYQEIALSQLSKEELA